MARERGMANRQRASYTRAIGASMESWLHSGFCFGCINGCIALETKEKTMDQWRELLAKQLDEVDKLQGQTGNLVRCGGPPPDADGPREGGE